MIVLLFLVACVRLLKLIVAPRNRITNPVVDLRVVGQPAQSASTTMSRSRVLSLLASLIVG